MTYSITRMDMIARVARCVARASGITADMVAIELTDNNDMIDIMLSVSCDSVQVFDTATKKLTSISAKGAMKVSYSLTALTNGKNKPLFATAHSTKPVLSEIAIALFEAKTDTIAKAIKDTLDMSIVNMVTLPKKTRTRKPKISLPVTND